MHTRFPRAATALAALLLALAGCDRRESPSGTAAHAELLPDYRTRGIVVVDPNPQRPNYWEYGQVPYGERPTHVFRLKNLDPDPVVIRQMQASCGCTQPTLRSADGTQLFRGRVLPGAAPFTLQPGAEAELEVLMDTTYVERMNVDKLGTVRIDCDSKTTPYLAFEAHVIVTRDFRCVPALIDLGEIAQGYAKQGRGDVTTDLAGTRPVILGLERVEGPFTAHVDEATVGNERAWIVSVEARADCALGGISGKIVLRTSASDGTGRGRDFEIPVAGQVVPRIVARPGLLRFAKGQDTAEVWLECLVPGEKVRVTGIEFDGPGPDFAVESTPVAAGDGRAAGWRIVFQAKAALPAGGFARRARIALDDPEFPEILLPLAGDAR